jgi:hypothetical protein
MLDEARKREKVANAFLAATMALSAAQSPKDFVKTGKIESPGVALMQRWGRVRGEAERNLDSGAVVPRNKKMKTFKKFVEEAYLIEGRRFVPKHEAQVKFDKMSPEEREKRSLRNSGANHGGWGTKLKDSLEKQRKRRSKILNPLTKDELESQAKRDLSRKNPSELSAIAIDSEENARKKQKAAARRLTKKTGVKHVEDHIQPLQQDKRIPKYRERFERVSPGDVASNLQVTSEPKNLRKGSKPPKKGQRGYGTTRAGAIGQRLDTAQKFSDKLDRLISSVRSQR